MKAHTSARAYFPGMGTAVADRTINRVIEDKDGSTRLETWEDVSHRVALGNSLLDPRGSTADEKMDFRTAEYNTMNHHLRQASLLMSGRHLQHGDATQPFRPMEVFTNCLGFDNKINTLEFGSIEIGKIVGETVHVQASDGEWRLASVNEYGTQKLFKIEFGNKNGGSIRHVVTATANHRWLLADGTVTEDLKIGDNLKAISSKFETDSQAIVHGIIFGDGTGHKSRSDTYRTGVSYGRTYASIRVCKQDTTKDEIHRIFDEAGYRYTQPSHANGDRVYYLGKYPFAKELPTTVDPGYIDGFIRGWWMADGYKKYDYSDAIIISTINEDAVNWLKDYASYAGYSIVSLRRQDRKEGDGSYANGKPLYTIRLRKDVNWMVRSIEQIGDHKVYCVEEPVTKSFTLSNGLLTGNCSTSVTTFLMFYLLLNGSGVGRAYDDDLIMVDFTKSPLIVPVIDSDHADVRSGEIQHFLTPREARHKYAHKPEDKVIYFKVPDSREGWAKAIEVIETNTFLGKHDSVLMLDFSEVRPRNTPIAGMQNRPASGPGPLMGAISKIAGLRDSDMAPWMAAMFADHYMAECVLVGGARRAARMATKYWRDRTIFDFINLKRGGFLWSSNNSVTIDEEFRKACKRVRDILANSDRSVEDLQHDGVISAIEGHAWRVLEALARASYFDGTGEPGIINQDKLVENNEGISEYLNGEFANGSRFSVDAETIPLMQNLAAKVYDKRYTMITNPCGEIALLMLGAYCVIADVVPFHATDDDDAESAFRTAVRALIRTNLMDSIYHKEVKRTNRIGVGITGFHEWVYARFGFNWYDIIDEHKSKEMWMTLSRFKRAIIQEASSYSKELGVVVPHTNTTFKPAGCASLDTAIKTTDGVLTMRELFSKHGITEDDLHGMESGTWIEPKIKTMVLDEGNVEREVTKLYLNGIKPVYEIEFEDGVVAKLTGNHKLKLLSGEWKRVDELTELDEILEY